jgi:electron transfer flavoprotein beta subunit
MKILVPFKQVLDPAGLMVNRKAGKVFVNREEYVMNPAARRALDAALKLKEEMGAEVIALSAGPERALDGLRDARALGADRAIFVPLDRGDEAVAATRVIVAVVNYLGGVNLILTGESTLDSGIMSGPRTAEALGWPIVSGAVACSVAGNAMRVIRRDDPAGRLPAGRLPAGRPGDVPLRDVPPERLYNACEADLPALVTFTREAPLTRYAHGGNIIAAYRDPKAVETVTLTDLGLVDSDLATVTEERGQSFPPEREFGRQVSVEEVAAMLKN